jgi:hypothetical protein
MFIFDLVRIHLFFTILNLLKILLLITRRKLLIFLDFWTFNFLKFIFIFILDLNLILIHVFLMRLFIDAQFGYKNQFLYEQL